MKTFTVGFLPHLLVAGVFMFLCMKQPDFGSARRAPAPHVHDALRGGREGRLHPRRVDPRRRVRRGLDHVEAVPLRARTSRGSTWTSTAQDLAYQPFQSVMASARAARGARASARACRRSTCPRRTTTSSPRSSARSSASSASSRSASSYLALVSRGVRAALPRAGRLRRVPRVRHLDDVRRAGAREPRASRSRSFRPRASRCRSSATAARRCS